MRWDGGGEGVVGGDDVVDDPDGARRDDDDDGDDFPLREENFPADFCLLESLFSLSGFRFVAAPEKLLEVCPDVFRSEGVSTPKGIWRGPHRQGAGPTCAKGGPASRGLPCPWFASFGPPSGSVAYF